MKDIDEIKSELETIRSKKDANRTERGKRDWYGLVFCVNGYASIIGDNCEGIWLGKEDEIIPYLKSKGINGEDVGLVLMAVEEFRKANENPPRVSKSHSSHLATENGTPCVFTPKSQSVVATFRKDPQFLSLLEYLISQGMGIRAIHSELKTKGYQVPMRTLGRWVKNRRDTI